MNIRAWRGRGRVFTFLALTYGVTSVYPDNVSPLRTLTTRTAEVNSVRLEDGSQVELNTRTHLEWSADDQERVVSLRQGEAFFDVKPDASRPFRVKLKRSEIRVLGTRFDVYQKSNGNVVVTVLEGAVLVEGYDHAGEQPAWHRELFPDQQIEYGPNGLVHDTSTLSTSLSVTRWRRGMVQFDNEPLPQVIDELSRYTDLRINIRDSRLNRVRVIGVMSTRDIRAALHRLEKHAPVSVTEKGETFFLDYRNDSRRINRGERSIDQ